MTKASRIRWIDALKGISILIICFIHLENWTSLFIDKQFIHRVISFGTLGVELTFICNGILLCSKYNALDDCKGNVYCRGGY